MDTRLETRHWVIVAPAGALTQLAVPQPLIHTIAPSEFEAWARCWRAGFRTAHEHQGEMQVRLERDGYACRPARLVVDLV